MNKQIKITIPKEKENPFIDDKNKNNNDPFMSFLISNENIFKNTFSQYETNCETYDTNEKNDFNEICKILKINIESKENTKQDFNMINEISPFKDHLPYSKQKVNKSNENNLEENSFNKAPNDFSFKLIEVPQENRKTTHRINNTNKNSNFNLLPPKHNENNSTKNNPVKLTVKPTDFLNFNRISTKNSIVLHKENSDDIGKNSKRNSVSNTKRRNNSLKYSNIGNTPKTTRIDTSESKLSTSYLYENKRNSQTSNLSRVTKEIYFDTVNTGNNNEYNKNVLEEVTSPTKNLSDIQYKNSEMNNYNIDNINLNKEKPNKLNIGKGNLNKEFIKNSLNNNFLFPEENYELDDTSYINSQLNSTKNILPNTDLNHTNFTKLFDENFSKVDFFEIDKNFNNDTSIEITEEINFLKKKSSNDCKNSGN